MLKILIAIARFALMKNHQNDFSEVFEHDVVSLLASIWVRRNEKLQDFFEDIYRYLAEEWDDLYKASQADPLTW